MGLFDGVLNAADDGASVSGVPKLVERLNAGIRLSLEVSAVGGEPGARGPDVSIGKSTEDDPFYSKD